MRKCMCVCVGVHKEKGLAVAQLKKVDNKILVKVLSEPALVVCFFIPTGVPTHMENSVLPTCPLKKNQKDIPSLPWMGSRAK